MELISRKDTWREFISKIEDIADLEDIDKILSSMPTIEERKEGKWIRTGRTNIYGGEELMCPFCGDRLMVQNIEYELYCRQCGALLGDRAKGE